MSNIDQVSIARALFDHPAFKNGRFNRFDAPGNEWVRKHWTSAVELALAAAGTPPNSEDFARALYDYPEWGYRKPFGYNARVCAPWRDAASDVLAGLFHPSR